MHYKTDNFKFYPILFDIKGNNFDNIDLLPFAIKLFKKYKRFFTDDYSPKGEKELLVFFIEEINAIYPWFVVGTYKNMPVGFGWLSHWHGNSEQNKYHSCQLHACLDKSFWGKTALLITQEFCGLLFDELKLKRIQMEIPEANLTAQSFARRAGFAKEGIIRAATVKNNKTINNVLFSKTAE